MSQSFAFIAFVALFFCLTNAETENINVTQANTPQYIFTPNVTRTWIARFSPNLRGFIIFDQYFGLKAGEEVTIYNGEIIEPKYRLANFTSATNLSIESQRLTFGKGQGFTVIFTTPTPPGPTTLSTTTSTTTTTTTTTPSTTTTTTTTPAPSTTMTPQFFMFLVSAYDEAASLMNNSQISGTFNFTLTDFFEYPIQTYSGVQQYWHFYPNSNTVRLSFLLLDSSALNTTNNNVTLKVYRGDANHYPDNTTFIKEYKKLADFDRESHILDFGETLSLYYNYPTNNVSNIPLGFRFIVSPNVNGTVTRTIPVTDASGNPITFTNPTVTSTSTTSNVTGTSTPSTTTTTSGAAPFIFSLAPIVISLIFQMCQTST